MIGSSVNIYPVFSELSYATIHYPITIAVFDSQCRSSSSFQRKTINCHLVAIYYGQHRTGIAHRQSNQIHICAIFIGRIPIKYAFRTINIIFARRIQLAQGINHIKTSTFLIAIHMIGLLEINGLAPRVYPLYTLIRFIPVVTPITIKVSICFVF